ncbi:MAG TPA: AAA family ATPase [Candidatus Saccharimonadales bacterium]|jgi:predicted kinase
MDEPKLILLHGFAGVGKTTITKRYMDEHPLIMNLEGDRIIVMVGQWLTHEAEARELMFKLGQSMIATCLEAGHSVIVPMLPINPEHVRTFERIAKESGAHFFEVALITERTDALQRLMKRGTWGEEGTPPLTQADLPVIEKLYNDMDRVLTQRPDAVRIHVIEDDHDDTYQQFLAAIGEL